MAFKPEAYPSLIFSVFFIVALSLVQSGNASISVSHLQRGHLAFETETDIRVRVRPSVFELDPNEMLFSVVAEPRNACDKVKSPPTMSVRLLNNGKPKGKKFDTWVLLAEGGSCDLKTKARHAAAAGYVGVIVKISGVDDAMGYRDLMSDHEIEGSLTLLNLGDWEKLEYFSHPKLYTLNGTAVTPPVRVVSVFERVQWWVTGTLYEVGLGAYAILYGVVNVVSQLFTAFFLTNYDWREWLTKESIYPAIFLLLAASPLLIGPFFYKERFGEGIRNIFEGPGDDDEYEEVEEDPKDVIERHMQNLGIEGTLTASKVGSAFRRLSRTCHPDKVEIPEDLNESEKERLREQNTERFHSITESQKVLLEYLEKKMGENEDTEYDMEE